jgi:AcrR family transcriptional regulator
VDKRLERSRERVLTAAYDLLVASGIGGFSVDEVARRSGVAKTTIYRQWPTREALVADACWRMVAEQEEETPDTGEFESDVEAILSEIGRMLWSANWAAVVPSVIDAAERDADFAEIHARIQEGHAAPLKTVLERGMARGELAAGADVAVLAAALLGPLFYRRWFSRQPIDEAFVRSLVLQVLRTRSRRP